MNIDHLVIRAEGATVTATPQRVQVEGRALTPGEFVQVSSVLMAANLASMPMTALPPMPLDPTLAGMLDKVSKRLDQGDEWKNE